jgi:hypothetical protein
MLALPPEAPALDFSAAQSADEAAEYAHDTQPLHALDAELRLDGRVAALERRLGTLRGFA